MLSQRAQSVLCIVASLLTLQIAMFTCAAHSYPSHARPAALTAPPGHRYMNYTLDKEIDQKLGPVRGGDDLHRAFSGGDDSARQSALASELTAVKSRLDVSGSATPRPFFP